MSGNNLWLTYPAASSQKLTTELNSLTDGSLSAQSAEIDNSTNQHMFADFQLDLASLTITSAAAFCDLFIVPTVDGTNYPDLTAGAGANYMYGYKVGVFTLKAVSATTARSVAQEIRIPPGKFKVALRNLSGVTLAASGNTLAMRSYSGSYT